MSMNARPYECLRGARDFAYAFGGRFLDINGRRARPSFRYIKTSCLNSHSLQVATITCALDDISRLNAPASSDITADYMEHISQGYANAILASTQEHENLLRMLYGLCVREQILAPERTYLFTAMALDSGAHNPLSKQFKVFAIDIEQTKDQKTQNTDEPESTRARNAYQNLHAQILIPLIMLPLGHKSADDQNTSDTDIGKNGASGMFLFDDWFCFYRGGRLVYECICADSKALCDAVGFVASMYDHEGREVFYPSDLVPKALDSSPESTAHDFVFTPLDKSLSQMTQDFLHTHDKEHAPLYNPYAKPLLQSTSFYSMLWLIACCALILALPYAKLAYATHLDNRAKELQTQNTQNAKTIESQKQLSAKLPAQSAQISQTIESLSSLHAKYTPRLYILSTLSQIVRDAEAWIIELSLQGTLERGETLLALSCQALKEESLHTLLNALQAKPELEIISTEIDKDLASGFRTNITLKISHV